MKWVYEFALYLLAIAYFPKLIYQKLRYGKRGVLSRFHIPELAASKKPRIWLHACSVGETKAASTLLPYLKDYDIIISDLTMPEMDGLELVKAIKASSIETPIVICTADQQESTREMAFEHGASDLFNKPDLFKVEKVKNLISQFVAS